MTPQHDILPMTTEQLIDLIDALTMLINEENALLRGGAPSSLAATLALKVRLGSELERGMRSGAIGRGSAPGQNQQLVRRSAALQQAMSENSTHLRAAMASTRRRVDAIMRALREQESRPGRYDSSGRRTLTHQAAPLSGRRI